MFFPNLAASAALLAVALATPLGSSATSSDDKSMLAKRANGLHLVNCVTYSAVIVRHPYTISSFEIHFFDVFWSLLADQQITISSARMIATATSIQAPATNVSQRIT
jgi:hypothetical protein